MSVFHRFAPFIQDYIYRNKWEELRPVQVKAAEAVFDTDENLLLSTGTASGKTEAAFLPVLTHLWENPSASVGVLYLSPLKALINDQFERLTGLLEEADIPVTKWHGDASAAAKKRVMKRPSGIIQTTPESLESMLMRNSSGAYRLFSDLRFVIVDEVHYFMDNDRGMQLLCLLERLSRLIGFSPRRIGLSATLGDTTSAEEWLCMGTDRGCVTPKGQDKGRSLRLSVRYFPIKQKIPNTDSKVLLENYYSYLYESTCGKRCILFSNSKGEVEENIAHLRRINEQRGSERDALYLVHHANISPALREFTEQRMKSGELPVCTGATVTLELGIDLGNLERIVQTGCPLTVSGLVQRLGRTGRRGGTAEMRFAFRHDTSIPPQEFYKEVNWDFVMCIAMILLYTRKRFIEPMRIQKLPYSLLYHQTMSYMASCGSVQPKELARYILTLAPFRSVSREDYLTLLRYMLENGQLERDEEGALLIGEKGEAAVSNFEFLAVFSVPDEYSVRCEAEEIGTVQSPFPEGAQFALELLIEPRAELPTIELGQRLADDLLAHLLALERRANLVGSPAAQVELFAHKEGRVAPVVDKSVAHQSCQHLLGGLLINGVQIVRNAIAIGNLACLTVEELVLIGIGTVGATYIDREARLLQSRDHIVQMGKRRGFKEHVLGDADSAHIRLIGGGEQVIVIDYLQMGVILKVLSGKLGPDIHRWFGGCGGIQVCEIYTVGAHKGVFGTAENNTCAALHTGDNYSIKHEAQTYHADYPENFFLHTSQLPFFKIWYRHKSEDVL